ncbi:RDD family protein [Brumicola nitratireducens]|uniref:RDD domain-containing protein n=1 Tax=Glaciecola nitratireducens (strain JCM 12485 / KCTC 12276 / FR1064) TaxID=1085623 RepID=G4QEI1_GLANF|nr:RDD family protein [Glaciecola nitratireducens]AEP28744.1 RDD domain-containing protein [Glaciecola nitratireducens FR1064]
MASSDNPKQHSFDLDSAHDETDIKKAAESLDESTQNSQYNTHDPAAETSDKLHDETQQESKNSIENKRKINESEPFFETADSADIESFEDLEDVEDIRDGNVEDADIEEADIKDVDIKNIDIKNATTARKHRNEKLSNKETRTIVTPYAFTVSPELLGQPLATPARRGVAMLIDVFLIAVLSGLSALLLAGFLALTFFKAGNRLKQQKRFNFVRLSFRGLSAFLIFVIVFTIVADLEESDESVLSPTAQTRENEDTMRSLLDLAAVLIDISCNNDSECLLKYAEGAAVGAAAMKIPIEDINATTSDIVAQKQWTDENKTLFMDKFINTLNEERNAYTDDIIEIVESTEPAEKRSGIYSILEWVKGIMSDLGLSLGWAALYFSVFTAWWRGQTIGKRIVGIEVVKLDGNYPSLWESFGRYGGYGAGFATGLLGFLQVYWDPNRQAIQDKISETLVLRLKPNVHKQ